MSYITRVLSTMSRFGMRSLNRPFSHFFWSNLSSFRLASPPGGMRLPPEGEPCTTYGFKYSSPRKSREMPNFTFIRFNGEVLQRASRLCLGSAFRFRMDNPSVLNTA